MHLVSKTALIIAMLLTFSSTYSQEGMIAVQSDFSVEETANRLEEILTENGINIFEIVDHKKGAASVDMSLLPTTLFIFGNPMIGTPIMQCKQSAAIDLPQKMLIWENSEGIVQIGYNNPNYLKNRHSIEGCDAELKKIGKALGNFAESAAHE